MVLKLPVLDEGGSVLPNRFHPAAPLNHDVWPAAVKYVDASMLDTAPATWQMDDGLWHVIDESVFFLLPQVRACEQLFSPKCFYLESILSQNQPEAHTRPRPSAPAHHLVGAQIFWFAACERHVCDFEVDKQRVVDGGNPSEHGITCEHCGCRYKMPRVAGDLHVAFETEGTRRFVKQQVFECKTKTNGVKCKGFGCHTALTVLHRLPLAVQSRIEMIVVPSDVTGLTAGARDVLRFDTKNGGKFRPAAKRFK